MKEYLKKCGWAMLYLSYRWERYFVMAFIAFWLIVGCMACKSFYSMPEPKFSFKTILKAETPVEPLLVEVPQPAAPVAETEIIPAEAASVETVPIEPVRLILTDEKIIAGYANFIRTDNPSVDEATAKQWAQYYLDKENELGLDIGILPAIGHVESNHRRSAKSNKDAHGIMQIQLETGRYWTNRLGIREEPQIKMKKLPKGASKSEIKAAQAELEKKRTDAEKELVRIISKPKVNIELGAEVLDCYLHEANEDLDKALVRYSYDATDYPQKVAKAREKVMAALQNAA